jgi:hypothetical protein
MIEFLVLRWWVLAAVLLFGALVAAAAMGLLSARRPGWSSTKRIVWAALVAPMLILLGVSAGILLTVVGDGGDGWDDLARGALLNIGAWGAMATFLAGLLGAGLLRRVVEE